MPFSRKTVAPAILLVALALTAACGGRPTKHLSSDAALLVPAQSTKQEVLAYLGPPDEKEEQAGGELWIYRQARPSLLRRTPYVGGALGSEEHDVLTVSFSGDVVSRCVYRNLSEEEYTPGAAAASGTESK